MQRWPILFFFIFNLMVWGPGKLAAREAVWDGEIETTGVQEIAFHGGSFWEGYILCKIKVNEHRLEATWDETTSEGRTRHTGSKNLTEAEISSLFQSIKDLRPAQAHEPCAIAADGPEESIELTYNQGQPALILVNQRSRPFVCGDRYVTDESFDRFLGTLKEIYPEPF